MTNSSRLFLQQERFLVRVSKSALTTTSNRQATSQVHRHPFPLPPRMCAIRRMASESARWCSMYVIICVLCLGARNKSSFFAQACERVRPPAISCHTTTINRQSTGRLYSHTLPPVATTVCALRSMTLEATLRWSVCSYVLYQLRPTGSYENDRKLAETVLIKTKLFLSRAWFSGRWGVVS